MLELPFPRARILIFDQARNAVGSIGYVQGDESGMRHFTEGGAEPLAAGLIVAEKLEEKLGREVAVVPARVRRPRDKAKVLLGEPTAARRTSATSVRTAAGPCTPSVRPAIELASDRSHPMAEAT